MAETINHTGQMIRNARLKAGLTQKELGERMGVSVYAINKLETRKASPTVNTLERIARALGTKLILGFE